MSFPVFPIFLMVYEFVLYMSNDMYMPFFPLIANEFSVNDEVVSLTLSAWLFGGAIAQIIIGPLSDRFGRKIVLMFGGVLFVVSCIVCALSTSMTLVLITRFLQGVGVCSMMIAGYACIHEVYEDHQAVKILATMSSIAIVAPMVGPVIGGYLALFYDWRVVFWILSVCATISIISLYFYMPNTKPVCDQPLSIKLMLSRYAQALSQRKFVLNSLCFSIGYSCIMLWISVSPFLLMQIYHMDTYNFGLAQIPVFGAFMIGARVTSYFIDKLEIAKLLKYAFCFTALGLLSLFPYHFLHKVEMLIASVSICMIGFGMLTAPLNRLAFTSSDAEKGITASVFYTVMMGSGAIMTKLFGYFEYTTFNFTLVFAILAIIQMALSFTMNRSEG